MYIMKCKKFFNYSNTLFSKSSQFSPVFEYILYVKNCTVRSKQNQVTSRQQVNSSDSDIKQKYM